MKCQKNTLRLALLALALGGLGLSAYDWLYRAAAGNYGLLASGHPLSVILCVFTAAVLVLIAVIAWKHTGQDTSPALPSPVLALGYFLAAGGILSTVLFSAPLTAGYPGLLWRIFGIAAPVCLAIGGVCCLLGKQPHFSFHLVACLFFLFHIIDHYRSWSGNSQILDYAFSLLAAMALALFCFYCAARDVELGRRRMRLGAGLAALFFCVVALSSRDCPLLYLGSIAWIVAMLSCPESAPDQQEPPHDPS